MQDQQKLKLRCIFLIETPADMLSSETRNRGFDCNTRRTRFLNELMAEGSSTLQRNGFRVSPQCLIPVVILLRWPGAGKSVYTLLLLKPTYY